MERIYIGSENVISAGFDLSPIAGFIFGILEVEFQDGEIWQYSYLPEHAVKAFKESPEDFLESFQKDNGQHFEKWGFSYREKDGFGIRNGVIEKYLGNDENVIVPSEVKKFGGSAFANNKKISSIEIPEGFTELSNWIFEGCENLISVKLPDSLEIINRDAFSKCSNLTQINIPASCKEIGEFAFFQCEKLEEIVLPSGLQSIGIAAFNGCKALRKVVIPEKVTELRNGTFADCANLEEIYIPATVQKISYTAFVKSLKIDYITPAGSYAEEFIKEAKKDNPAERKERKFQEWRRIFNFSSRKKGAFISEVFVDSPIIYIPDNIGKMGIAGFDKERFPEDIAVICSYEIFKKLPQPNQYATVMLFLENAEEYFSMEEKEYLMDYAKKKQITLLDMCVERKDYNRLHLIMAVKKVSSKIMSDLIERYPEVEVRLILMNVYNDMKMTD